MWKRSSAAREAGTTIPCKKCRTKLMAKRNCHHAYLHCTTCAQDYEIQEYLNLMDTELEQFLEAINCDRI